MSQAQAVVSKIKAAEVAVVMYTAEDGKQFKTLEQAEKYQAKLDFVVVVPADVEAFLNSEGETGRGRTMRANAIAEFRAFLSTWDGEAVELDAEKASAKAARAAKLKGAGKDAAPANEAEGGEADDAENADADSALL
ncbi:hypothetical protein [Pseudomonas laurylsulfatiphila]|uniref:hypothetical protein n=1 Tax=Pseudomonas laurylsulfatiphila TaxID=2011015 RepID=UPI003D1A97FC